MRAALRTWNALHSSLYGEKLFSVRVDESGGHSPISNTCEFEGNNRQIIVRRAKTAEEWAAAGFPSNSPGLNIRCSTEAEGLVKQTIILGPDNGRVGGREQFQSVFLHEVGHSIGLDHSCDMAGGAGKAGCNSLDMGHAFRRAVMFPYLTVNEKTRISEIKSNLRENDEERAQCILQAR